METNEKLELLQEIIDFLVANEQYGDNWEEHITLLIKIYNNITNKF
tara:strand:+ start:83 stop:220 length:138 start_codon:yes stop_codon:yes gene_type:complete